MLGDVGAQRRAARSPGRPAGRSRGRGCARSRAGATGRRPGRRARRRTGVSSPTSCRSTSSPCEPAGAGDGQPVVVERRPCSPSGRGGRAARRRPGWSSRGQSRTVTAPAGGRGQRQERRGVGQVGLDRVVDRADRPGRDPPAAGLGVVDLDAVLAQHRDGHVDVGQRRAPACRRGRRRRPRRSGRRRAAGRRRTGWTPEASSTTLPPRHAAGAERR